MFVKVSWNDGTEEILEAGAPCLVEVAVVGSGLRTLRIGDGDLAGVSVHVDEPPPEPEPEAIVEEKPAPKAAAPKKTPAKKPAAKKAPAKKPAAKKPAASKAKKS